MFIVDNQILSLSYLKHLPLRMRLSLIVLAMLFCDVF